MKVLGLDEIKSLIQSSSREELIQCIEEAFMALSNGTAQIPPVGHLGFEEPPGDMHIKYGYIKNDPYYVIKVASGFYKNQEKGLPNGNGMMLIFDATTGQPECLLQDNGYLTDLRTALAGVVAAKHMGPGEINGIGIIGTGVQARLQLQLLNWVTDCKAVYVYGRTAERSTKYVEEMSGEGYRVVACNSPTEVASRSNLIVTTTASREAVLTSSDILPGTHITAMGSDVPGKQELDSAILGKAWLVACDSKSQCIDHGETHFALRDGQLEEAELLEIGQLITTPFERPKDAITIADLTGIATQDIKIATFVLAGNKENTQSN